MHLTKRPFMVLPMLLLLSGGCTMFKVDPPPAPAVILSEPAPGGKVDFAIETVDLINRDLPIGRVGDTFWGGQYQVVLSDSLKDCVEATAAQELMDAGFVVYRYPGQFAWRRLNPPDPPLHLLMELQTLSLSRHPDANLFADHVVGVCKIRAVLLGQEGEVVYQRQFVGKADTNRPTDELVLPGVGLISRAGISAMLQYLLKDTLDDFRSSGIPEMRTVFEEYRAAGGTMTETGESPDETGDERVSF